MEGNRPHRRQSDGKHRRRRTPARRERVPETESAGTEKTGDGEHRRRRAPETEDMERRRALETEDSGVRTAARRQSTRDEDSGRHRVCTAGKRATGRTRQRSAGDLHSGKQSERAYQFERTCSLFSLRVRPFSANCRHCP